MFHFLKVFVFILTIASLEIYGQDDSTFKSFNIRSAMIVYDIKGDGNLTDNTHLSVNGRSTLLFESWGARKLYKEKYIESTTGAVENTKTIRTLYLEDHGKVHRVDFEKQKIETNEDAITKISITNGENLYQKAVEEMIKKGKRVGDSSVLGYPCEEWIFKGKKRCYTRGVPIKEESTVSGIPVIKIAISIRFDINISNDSFALPEFNLDKKEGFLMETRKETLDKNIPEIKKATDELISNIERLADTEDLEIEVSAGLTEKIFQEQKSWLPKLLNEMQEARVCLENSFKATSANNCLSRLTEIEEQMSGEKSHERNISIWTELTGQKIMDDLEEDILDMKRRMPCIRRSQNFDDLSKCMHSEK